MEICKLNHVEIIHDKEWCPLCEANKIIRDLRKYLNTSEDEIEELKKLLESKEK